jgi:predicted RNA-binding protein with PUA-like domain
MATFLFKTEPGEYAFDDLLKEERATWDGVSNPQALGYLRQAADRDDVLIYETGSRKAIVGMAEVSGEPYEDPDRPGLNGDGEPKYPVVDIVPIKRAVHELPLDAIRQDTRFQNLPLVRQPRLSVMILPDEVAFALKQMTGLMRTPAGRGSRGMRKTMR